jgi:hypothetical protein
VFLLALFTFFSTVSSVRFKPLNISQLNDEASQSAHLVSELDLSGLGLTAATFAK